MLNWIVLNRTDYFHKMDLALNNLQKLICHKTQQTKPYVSQSIYLSIYLSLFLSIHLWLCLSLFICISIYFFPFIYLSLFISFYQSIHLSNYVYVYLSSYKLCFTSIQTEAVFTNTEMNNEWNINFFQNSPLGIQQNYSSNFSTTWSTQRISLLR